MKHNPNKLRADDVKQRFYTKFYLSSNNRFFKYALPIAGGIIIGLLTTLIMKFMGKHISF